jgi:hypothetical protein
MASDNIVHLVNDASKTAVFLDRRTVYRVDVRGTCVTVFNAGGPPVSYILPTHDEAQKAASRLSGHVDPTLVTLVGPSPSAPASWGFVVDYTMGVASSIIIGLLVLRFKRSN